MSVLELLWIIWILLGVKLNIVISGKIIYIWSNHSVSKHLTSSVRQMMGTIESFIYVRTPPLQLINKPDHNHKF